MNRDEVLQTAEREARRLAELPGMTDMPPGGALLLIPNPDGSLKHRLIMATDLEEVLKVLP